MTSEKSQTHLVRPWRVFVAPGSDAEKSFRARVSMPSHRAPGIPSTPTHDLSFHGGKTIQDLVFTNFYVGGQNAWAPADMQSIDQALAAAMSDQRLNNVMSQYFPSGKITSTFQASHVLAGPPPAAVSQGDVENLLQMLFQAGTLDAFDLANTVFNFMLPSGTVLNTNAAPSVAAISARVERSHKASPAAQQGTAFPHATDDSKHGLGGYHGSIHVNASAGSQTLYYAVGVFSEQLPDGSTNGIPVFDESWKNVVATFYHELNEARTDADVEDAIRAGDSPTADSFLGWVSSQGEECGDFPVAEANPLTQVFQEIALANGNGTVPIQFQYSDADHGPGEPRATPAPFAGRKASASAHK